MRWRAAICSTDAWCRDRPVARIDRPTLTVDTSANVTRIAAIARRPRSSNGRMAGPVLMSADDDLGVHAAEVVTGHVAEHDVPALGQVHVQVVDAVGLARLEDADRGVLH